MKTHHQVPQPSRSQLKVQPEISQVKRRFHLQQGIEPSSLEWTILDLKPHHQVPQPSRSRLKVQPEISQVKRRFQLQQEIEPSSPEWRSCA
uniref:Uncharacterized protein n=1 Tax=Oryza rufipogon TaxID=4529 RepID=A0A0E0QI51_ORYRU